MTEDSCKNGQKKRVSARKLILNCVFQKQSAANAKTVCPRDWFYVAERCECATFSDTAEVRGAFLDDRRGHTHEHSIFHTPGQEVSIISPTRTSIRHITHRENSLQMLPMSRRMDRFELWVTSIFHTLIRTIDISPTKTSRQINREVLGDQIRRAYSSGAFDISRTESKFRQFAHRFSMVYTPSFDSLHADCFQNARKFRQLSTAIHSVTLYLTLRYLTQETLL